jgi:hypothetical protein
MTVGPAPLRAVRAVAFATAALVLAVSAHRAGGGAVPGLAAVAGGALGLAGAAWPLAGRQRSIGAIAGAVLASQAALHVLFAGAAHDPGAILGCVSHDGVGQVSTPVMLACHAVAALALALLLERGETWACRVVSAAAARAGLLRRVPPVALVASLAHLRGALGDGDHLARAAWLRPLASGRSACGPPCAA